MANVAEDIKKAGKERKLLRIVYRGLTGEISDRIIEVYEIKNGRVYGWDIDKDDHIRNFMIVGILETEILDQQYSPKWPIKV